MVACPVTLEFCPSCAAGNDPYHKELVLVVRNGLARVNKIENCTYCGVCVQSCPSEAIRIDEEVIASESS